MQSQIRDTVMMSHVKKGEILGSERMLYKVGGSLRLLVQVAERLMSCLCSARVLVAEHRVLLDQCAVLTWSQFGRVLGLKASFWGKMTSVFDRVLEKAIILLNATQRSSFAKYPSHIMSSMERLITEQIPNPYCQYTVQWELS